MSFYPSSEDLIVWPCGTVCYREELHEMTHLSDDYRVVSFGTQEHSSLSWALDALTESEFKAQYGYIQPILHPNQPLLTRADMLVLAGAGVCFIIAILTCFPN